MGGYPPQKGARGKASLGPKWAFSFVYLLLHVCGPYTMDRNLTSDETALRFEI